MKTSSCSDCSTTTWSDKYSSMIDDAKWATCGFYIFALCLFIYISVRAAHVQGKLNAFDNCTNCLDIAVASDKEFLLSMCKDVAKGSDNYGKYYDEHERLFHDGVVGAYGTITFTGCLGFMAAALAFMMVGAAINALDHGNEKNKLKLFAALFLFAFIWSLMCLMFALDLGLANEETIDSNTCWELAVTSERKQVHQTLTNWLWTWLATILLVIAILSALAVSCTEKVRTFFTWTASLGFLPGLIGTGYCFILVTEYGTAEPIILLIICVCMLIGTAWYAYVAARESGEETSNVSV